MTQRVPLVALVVVSVVTVAAAQQQVAPPAAGPPAAATAVTPQPPPGFAMTPAEQAFLDQVLAAWEQRSDAISTYSCDFTRHVYDPVFGPGADAEGNPIAKTIEEGAISYQKPDRGSFEIEKIEAWDAKAGRHALNREAIHERWVCDGKSVYEFKPEQKIMVVRPIPPALQGQNITDGPLPFLFGAKAQQLKERYWLRVDRRALQGTVRINAAPKRRADAANYRQVDVMLDRATFLPSAMQVTLPDNSRMSYRFKIENAQVNSRVNQLWNQLFAAPRAPFGWRTVVEQPQQAAAAQAAPARR